MTVHLSEADRSRLRGIIRRPRSRKQLHRSEALLALDEGRPVEEVARRLRVGVERVESWVERFRERRFAFLDEPSAGRPTREPDAAEDEEDG